MPQADAAPLSPGGGTPSGPQLGGDADDTSPGPDEGSPDPYAFDDTTQWENPLMGPDNANGITPAAAMENLAEMPTSQRMALAQVAADPNLSGALLDMLGPSFMAVLQAMGSNGIPGGLPGPGQPGAPMPGPTGNGDSGMGMPSGGPGGGASLTAAPPGATPPMPMLPARRPLATVRA